MRVVSSRFFRAYSDSPDGEAGVFCCEVRNAEIVRHVSVYAGVMYWATPTEEYDSDYAFTDQPEFDRVEYDAEITAAEFHDLWSAALRQKRAGDEPTRA